MELEAWPVRARFGLGVQAVACLVGPGAPGAFVSRVYLLEAGCLKCSRVRVVSRVSCESCVIGFNPTRKRKYTLAPVFYPLSPCHQALVAL